MDDRQVQRERAQNLWASFARRVESIGHATSLEPLPDFPLGRIGGLSGPKEEIQTYACAATNPAVYARWGTWPPSGLLLIGKPGVGKSLLARALASLTETSFVNVAVPRLVIEVIHRSGGKVGELLQGWSQTLAEMPTWWTAPSPARTPWWWARPATRTRCAAPSHCRDASSAWSR
jgi:ATP-dependent 26S proteasome regulatory subunit